jgi:hypothetical protein
MSESDRLLVFIFESREKAHCFYRKFRNLSLYPEFHISIRDAIFAHKNERGRMHLELTSPQSDSVLKTLVTTKFARQLQPSQSALLTYVSGDVMMALLNISKDYELDLLRSTLPVEISGQVKLVLETMQTYNALPDYAFEPTNGNGEETEPDCASAPPDDLTALFGIGPKIAAALQSAGIETYHQLSKTNQADLQAILREAGIVVGAGVASWPVQAGFAASGDWSVLYEFKLWRGIPHR